jgi:hypothetical protein
MNGCTASVVAGVRGTTYVLEANSLAKPGLKVLEGEVVVSQRQEPNDTEPTAGQQTILSAFGAAKTAVLASKSCS